MKWQRCSNKYTASNRLAKGANHSRATMGSNILDCQTIFWPANTVCRKFHQMGENKQEDCGLPSLCNPPTQIFDENETE